jgi:two-component system, OmpR family, response regulator
LSVKTTKWRPYDWRVHSGRVVGIDVDDARQMRILLVEDEERLARVVIKGLREEGHAVDHCTRAHDARAQIDALEYDVVVLDWMLADGDGLELVRALRRAGVRTPILMLTARGSTPEKVTGLRAGADDYLAKPFDFDELLARIDALHRRSEGTSTEWCIGAVTLDGRHRALRGAGVEVPLTAREYALLGDFFAHPAEVRTRAHLLSTVWGHAFEGDPNILDVYIGYVRTKLAKLEGAPEIRAVRGVGFRILEPASR